MEKHSDTQILAVSGSEIHAFKWESIGDIRLMNGFSRYVDANDLPFSSSLLCDCFGNQRKSVQRGETGVYIIISGVVTTLFFYFFLL